MNQTTRNAEEKSTLKRGAFLRAFAMFWRTAFSFFFLCAVMAGTDILFASEVPVAPVRQNDVVQTVAPVKARGLRFGDSVTLCVDVVRSDVAETLCTELQKRHVRAVFLMTKKQRKDNPSLVRKIETGRGVVNIKEGNATEDLTWCNIQIEYIPPSRAMQSLYAGCIVGAQAGTPAQIETILALADTLCLQGVRIVEGRY